MSTLPRRKFLQLSTTASLAGTTIFAGTTSKEKEMKNIFIHHVFFWLKNPGSTEDRDKLVAGLQKLSKATIFKQFHIGKPADTHRDVVERSYAVSWLLIFDNAADQETYQTDPMHLEFIKECSHLWEKVKVHDSIDA